MTVFCLVFYDLLILSVNLFCYIYKICFVCIEYYVIGFTHFTVKMKMFHIVYEYFLFK
jgi:hypothetical protein